MPQHEYLDKTGLDALWARVGELFARKTDLSAYATTESVTSGLAGKADTAHTHSAADVTSGTLPVARGGTGVTTEDALAQLVFANAPEASPTQAGVVKTLSDQDFCEFMGIDYNPDDWS